MLPGYSPYKQPLFTLFFFTLVFIIKKINLGFSPSMLSSSSPYKQPLFIFYFFHTNNHFFNFIYLLLLLFYIYLANLCKSPYFVDELYQSIFIFFIQLFSCVSWFFLISQTAIQTTTFLPLLI